GGGGRGGEAAAQPVEVRGGRIHLCAVRGVDRCWVPLDLAVIDVYVGGARRHADAARADVTVGDVNLAAIQSAHRIPIEYQVAVVDVQKPRALADDRLVATLQRGAARGLARALGRGSGGLRGG